MAMVLIVLYFQISFIIKIKFIMFILRLLVKRLKTF